MIDFKQFKKYDTIVVTGSQRSGTQIVSRILAVETGKRFVHEKEFDAHDFDVMIGFLGMSVIHAPALCHRILDIPDRILVVFVQRDFGEIIASQERIGWDEEMVERVKYADEFGISLKDPRPICEIKYSIFMWNQRMKRDNCQIIHYNDLKDHPLFLAKEKRVDFSAWQTTEEQ